MVNHYRRGGAGGAIGIKVDKMMRSRRTLRSVIVGH
jgi:hypothetical protein